MTYLERYQQGDREAVWAELQALGEEVNSRKLRDDARAVAAKIEAMNLPAPAARPSTRPYAEQRGMDPDGNLFDISEHGYSEIEYAEDRAKKTAKAPAKV